MYHRRSIRLSGHDYSEPGAYFVTVCTKHRICLFGEIIGNEMRLNEAGLIVRDSWTAMAVRFPSVTLDAFVVMPNHFHCIVIIGRNTRKGAASSAPTILGTADEPSGNGGPTNGGTADEPSGNGGPTNGGTADEPTGNGGPTNGPSLGRVVRAFKSLSAINVNRLLGRTGHPLWQRNYYERIIRDESSLSRVREYIQHNPARWAFDRENPHWNSNPKRFRV